jgi:hypothetical protein
MAEMSAVATHPTSAAGYLIHVEITVKGVRLRGVMVRSSDRQGPKEGGQ